jgi:hypothetical protein
MLKNSKCCAGLFKIKTEEKTAYSKNNYVQNPRCVDFLHSSSSSIHHSAIIIPNQCNFISHQWIHSFIRQWMLRGKQILYQAMKINGEKHTVCWLSLSRSKVKINCTNKRIMAEPGILNFHCQMPIENITKTND